MGYPLGSKKCCLCEGRGVPEYNYFDFVDGKYLCYTHEKKYREIYTKNMCLSETEQKIVHAMSQNKWEKWQEQRDNKIFNLFLVAELKEQIEMKTQ